MSKTTSTSLTLAELVDWTGLDVLDHLEREVTVPVVAGLQAQGDVIVVPHAFLPEVTVAPRAAWEAVPPGGIELLRAAAGGNPHALVAEPGTCRWTSRVSDPARLALGVLDASGVAYLIHPEHGGTGIAPGRYVIRRQRERSAGPGRRPDRFIAD
jgi:hypothetical protein